MLASDHLNSSETPNVGRLPEDLHNLRRKAFSDELVAIAFEDFKEYLKTQGLQNDETFEEITEWPEDFDLENIRQI